MFQRFLHFKQAQIDLKCLNSIDHMFAFAIFSASPFVFIIPTFNLNLVANVRQTVVFFQTTKYWFKFKWSHCGGGAVSVHSKGVSTRVLWRHWSLDIFYKHSRTPVVDYCIHWCRMIKGISLNICISKSTVLYVFVLRWFHLYWKKLRFTHWKSWCVREKI